MNIRNISLATFCGIIILSISSCLKFDDSQIKADEERKKNEPFILEDYIASNNIIVTPTASGLYYIETLAGSGDSAKINSWIEIKFTCRLVSGNTVVMTNDLQVAKDNSLFQASEFYGPTRLVLGKINNYTGLNQGIAMMREGGKARLIFPSSLGLGGMSTTNIPAYSSLIFDIELVKVIPDIKIYEDSLMMEYLKADSISTDSVNGIFIKITKEGTGDLPDAGDHVTVTYKGKFMNGTVFDAGTNPLSIVIGNFKGISAFEEGVKRVRKGGSATIVIPFYHAYGEFATIDRYNGRLIFPPFTTLVFDISVTDIVKP
jgi:FKBP-type peptidyl-prolyl cis-trans isomerase FkpA